MEQTTPGTVVRLTGAGPAHLTDRPTDARPDDLDAWAPHSGEFPPGGLGTVIEATPDGRHVRVIVGTSVGWLPSDCLEALPAAPAPPSAADAGGDPS